MGYVFSPEIWVSLLTLTVLEVVLGIDNLIFGVVQRRVTRQAGLTPPGPTTAP
jgi:hypothetical protein